jgi:hypothetical protein
LVHSTMSVMNNNVSVFSVNVSLNV